MAEALDFAVGVRVKADIELQPLAAINQIFDRLEDGDVASRVVLDFSDSSEELKGHDESHELERVGAA
jgi:propanol-preferring alcohol dehydrogenase